MAKLSYEKILKQHIHTLKDLQYKSGLFAASSKKVNTGYDKSWLRDNFYEALPFYILKDYDTVKRTYRAILDLFLKHEYKIDHAIRQKPTHRHEYIHARFHPETFDEFWEEWGNKQNDSIGAILFMVGHLEENNVHVLENKNDFRIIQKLVDYLITLEYWKDPDSGMWEENEEIHASSIGSCIAGLKSVKKIRAIDVPQEVIRKGQIALKNLLPRESKQKFVDLSLLSLIYPYNVVSQKQEEEILKNVEYHLVKRKGVIRYKGDYYYNKNPDGYSEEAEWTFGFSWLAIIYELLGDAKKAKKYEALAIDTINSKDEVPELYYSNSDKYNENSPLGWSEAMLILAVYELNKKHIKKTFLRKLFI